MQEFLEECNLTLAQGELRKIPQVMKFLIQTYSKMIKSADGFGPLAGDLEPNGYHSETDDVEMTNQWGDSEEEDISKQYIQDIHIQVAQDKIS